MSTTILLGLLALLVPFLNAPAQPETSRLQVKLSAHIEEYNLSEDDFLQALIALAARFRLPMGVEWIRTPATLREVKLSWRGRTVLQIVRSLVRSQPGYDFEVKNGILHIFRKDLAADPNNFLNLKLGKFEVRNQFVGVANTKLYELASHDVSPPRPVPHGGEGGSIATGLGDRPVTVELEGATYREALDALSLAADFKVWVVTFSEDSYISRTGFRRTLSPKTGRAAPDDRQPNWELLMWGRKPYV